MLRLMDATPAPDLLTRARELLARHPLIDGHNDLPWKIRTSKSAPGDLGAYDLATAAPDGGHTDLPRLRAGGIGGQFWSVYVPGEGPPAHALLQLEQLDLARRMIDRYPDDLEFCLTADDVERAMAAGRIASLLGMEGGHALEGSLGALRAFSDLGARYLTLTHNTSNEIGGDYDGNTFLPQGMDDVSSYPVLFAELLARGWSEENLAKLANRNILRVMRDAESVADG